MEIVEHVANVDFFMHKCSEFLNKNGIMFVSTINRNLKSYLFAIIGAEYILRWLPIGTHDWNSFIKPDELVCSPLSELPISIKIILSNLLVTYSYL